eukprot:CAMPEP_0114353670 /NCGR_PEP_ID=MMETSP0101-20121206/18834_1 /TAXON_ID=38822 ORGANISM="Pteridomonas danica, Strain PT" /NCGR_SAMPLE_ID=MMETSP0101 /ASSEMBLY_ACC=CAM_ASM_000211 /LENGTH=226 /DNA_ID=CAMNT_0001494615 /DNA_START=382 /DNA_END=1062 /DNA_ORIENTATION=-
MSALDAAGDAARKIASTSTPASSTEVEKQPELQEEQEPEQQLQEQDASSVSVVVEDEKVRKKRIEAEVSAAVSAAKRVLPQIASFVVDIIEMQIEVIAKFIDKDYSKLYVLREVPVDSSPLIFKLFARIAATETLSPSLQTSKALLSFASSMEIHFNRPNVRFVVPFLAACDRIAISSQSSSLACYPGCLTILPPPHVMALWPRSLLRRQDLRSQSLSSKEQSGIV